LRSLGGKRIESRQKDWKGHRLFAKSFFHGSDHDFESGWIVDGHFRKLLAIELDLSLDESGDEFTVSQAVHSSGSVDTDDPEPTELAALDSAVTISESTCSNQIFLHGPKQTTTTAYITFGTSK
jgi:hypothetical protein